MNLLKPQSIFIVMVGVTLFFSSCKEEEEGCTDLLALNYDFNAHQRQLMHLGHPEYNVGRILGEMERDRARGDVPPPENFDAAQPQTLWRSHRNLLFQQWLWFCYQRVSLKA